MRGVTEQHQPSIGPSGAALSAFVPHDANAYVPPSTANAPKTPAGVH
ncbi:MAG TPA: hypothetical protein VIK50_13120 [Gemmatimonadaceae bacterium]